MCDLSIILLRGDVREQIMNAVVQVVVDRKLIRLTGLFGETKTIEGAIKEINVTVQLTIHSAQSLDGYRKTSL